MRRIEARRGDTLPTVPASFDDVDDTFAACGGSRVVALVIANWGLAADIRAAAALAAHR